MMHIDESILNAENKIDETKTRWVSRMGGNWYSVADEYSMFVVPKPNTQLGSGFDALPERIRNSSILSGNDLGQLANVESLPVIDPAYTNEDLAKIVQYFSLNSEDMELEIHKLAAKLLREGRLEEAWQVLLS